MERRTRIALVAMTLVGVLAVAAEPVAAQNSVTDQLIGNLNTVLLYAAIPITLLVQAVLLYAVIKFRNNDDPSPTKENRRLEITWTVATAVVLLFVGVASFQVMASPYLTPQQEEIPEDAVEVEVVAYNYNWDFIYPDNDIQTTGEAVVPTDTPIYFSVTADESRNSYIHGFAVPELGLKQDANPGQHNLVATEVYEQGTYQGYCTKYCGIGHSDMLFTVTAVSPQEYQTWVNNGGQFPEGNGAANSSADDGGGGGGNSSA